MSDNLILDDIDWHFPEKAPRVGVRPVSITEDEPIKVVLTGDPFHFGSFDSGDEFAVCDYDLPDENLTQITRGLTRGPVLFQGKKCTEILCREFAPDGELLQLVRRLICKGQRFGSILCVNSRRPAGIGTTEVTNLEFPLNLEPKARWNVVRAPGLDREGTAVENTERITGVFDINVGKSKHRCLRWLRPRTTDMGFREADEIFVDVKTGTTVLMRGFIGKGYPDIEAFQRSPKLEVGGEIFYLRYFRRVIRIG